MTDCKCSQHPCPHDPKPEDRSDHGRGPAKSGYVRRGEDAGRDDEPAGDQDES